MSTDDDSTAATPTELQQDEQIDADVRYLEQVTSATTVPLQELMGYASAAKAVGTSYRHTIDSFLQADPQGRLHEMLADRDRFARAAAVLLQRMREEAQAAQQPAPQPAPQDAPAPDSEPAPTAPVTPEK